MSDLYLGVELDHDKILSWRNDPRVYRWCRQVGLLSKADHEKWLASLAADKSLKMYTIHQTGTDYIMGVCGLTNMDHIARHAEFSLYLAPGWQGKGYGTKSLRMLLDHGFHSYNLNKIWGEVFSDNERALIMFKSLGMKVTTGHVEHYFKNGKLVNTNFVYILQSDWIAKQNIA